MNALSGQFGAAAVARRSARSRLLLLLLFAFLLPGAAAGSTSFTFERLNRTFEGVVDRLAPVQVGPAQVVLRSPEHAFTLRRHVARLTPGAAGEHAVELEIDFSGWGQIEADVTMGTLSTRLTDRVVAPGQSLAISASARIERTEGGYLVTPTAVPPSVTVRIESQLARRLFSLCRPMGLVLVNLDCLALESALSTIDVPLPAPGESYLLPDAELTELEREGLDLYLARSGS
jgi:hypothetical protein